MERTHMIESFKLARRVFFRSTRLLVPYAAIFAATVFVLLGSLTRTSMGIVDYLTTSLQIGLLGFLYFAFAAYEMSSQLERVGGDEAVSVNRGAKQKLTAAQLLTLLIPLLFWTLLILVFQWVACSYRSISYAPYFWHCILAVVRYCFLPGFIGLLLGSCLAGAKRPTAYCTIFVLTFLSSSICMSLFGASTIGAFSVAGILDWFGLSVPNADWIGDSVYGVALEPCRWVLTAFWCSLLLAVLLWKNRARKRRVLWLLPAVCLLLALFCGVSFALRDGDSIMQKDGRPDGLLTKELNYRTTHAIGEASPANFTVESYTLDLSVYKRLDATATIRLRPAQNGEYRFTLLHCYEVTAVEDEAGNTLAYERDGDFLDIRTDGTLSSVVIRYHGNAGKYYANSQAICLPAYCAYYPLPGHLVLWDSVRGSTAPVAGMEHTEFSVRVSSGLQLYSNLPETSPNCFAGTTDGVSLYAGMLEKKEENGLTYLYSPLSVSPSSWSVDAFSDSWASYADMVGDTRSLSLEGKTLVFQPFTIAAAGAANEKAVVLDDQILLCNFKPTAQDVCASYILGTIPYSDETMLLRMQMESFLYSWTPGMQLSAPSEKPPYADLEILKKYPHSGVITDVDEWNAYGVAEAVYLYDLFQYQVLTLGEQTVLRQVYQYLLAEEHDVNQIDFLYNMGGDEG